MSLSEGSTLSKGRLATGHRLGPQTETFSWPCGLLPTHPLNNPHSDLQQFVLTFLFNIGQDPAPVISAVSRIVAFTLQMSSDVRGRSFMQPSRRGRQEATASRCAYWYLNGFTVAPNCSNVTPPPHGGHMNTEATQRHRAEDRRNLLCCCPSALMRHSRASVSGEAAVVPFRRLG